MQPHHPVTLAVIELASNSISALIARCTSDRLDRITEESTVVGLRASVKATGGISPEAREDALAAIRDYQALATKHGAERILVIAHKAVRQAGNREAFLAAIRQETGLEIKIIGGTLVAALACYGSISGPDTPADVGVLDVGPGSTEVIVAQQRQICWLTSVPVGSGWLRDTYLSSNPPSPDEVERAEEFLRAYIPRLQIPQVPPALIATGSSAKALLTCTEQASKAHAHRDRLTREDLQGYRQLLLSRPTEALAQHYGQSFERARVLPAGVLIVLAVLECLHLDTLRLTALGLPQGALLAYARYGENWLDHAELDPTKEGNVPPLLSLYETTRPCRSVHREQGGPVHEQPLRTGSRQRADHRRIALEHPESS
jgi:exopolyphosphatase/pppGpp-phosphohydrolase